MNKENNISISLSQLEIMWASQIGTIRHTEAIKKGLPDKHGFDGDGLMIHINGACGEMAVAKALDIYWAGSINTFKKERDVGDWEVRTRSKDYYDLLIRPDDDDKNIYILVTGEIPNFKIHGFISGKNGKRQEWMKDYGGRPPAYFVPKNYLTNIKEIKK